MTLTSSRAIFRADWPVESIFGLNGNAENDLSAAFAYALKASDLLCGAVLRDLGVFDNSGDSKTTIHIQTARRGEGITDVELRIPSRCLIVFEAKRNSIYPSAGQLRKYAHVCQRFGHSSRLVALTNTDETAAPQPKDWATLPVPVQTRSWRWVRQTARAALRKERRPIVRFVLRELNTFLEEFMGLERAYSNLVYVVSLGPGHPKNWKLSWIDIVEKKRRYFYPFGAKSWPAPPTYIGFRYRGILQSIHHVETFEVVPDLRRHFSGASRGDNSGPHYLLRLGSPMRPHRSVKAGQRIFRSARVWCMLDTLLTSKTISEALDITERRRREAEALS